MAMAPTSSCRRGCGQKRTALTVPVKLPVASSNCPVPPVTFR